METKLIAAEIATGAGVTTIVTSSKRPQVVCDIIDYHAAHPPAPPALPRRSDFISGLGDTSTPVSGTATPTIGRGPDPISSALHMPPSHPNGGESVAINPLSRPPHTVFTPSALPMRDLRSWATHTLYPAGAIVIDAGAHAVLSKRESGGRLLPVGVVGVRGVWASGQSVRVCVVKDGAEVEVGRGLANYNSEQVEKVMGHKRCVVL
jgi:glutamate 5-kinase